MADAIYARMSTYLCIFCALKTRFMTTLLNFHNYITKTRLYNFDPLKPHFYIVKLGFTGVYIIFLISAEAILTSTHNLCFQQKYEKLSKFFI